MPENPTSEDTVDYKHPEYEAQLRDWETCRLVLSGQEAVKKSGSRFLPTLKGQDAADYESYKHRALFFEASGRTLRGLIGALFAKEPVKEGVPEGTDIEDNFLNIVTPYEAPIEVFLHEVAKEVLSVGKTGVLVDWNSNANSCQLSQYLAEDITNWKVSTVEGKSVFSLVVLREQVDLPTEFTCKTQMQYRVLRLVPTEMTDGSVEYTYIQQIWVKGEEGETEKGNYFLAAQFTPTNSGVSFNRIPFFLINAEGTQTLCRPPLLPLINVNISHYHNSADLEHGRHYTGLPTPWVAGFSPKMHGNLTIGSHVAWVASNPQAKASYMEFTGQGLGSLETALKEKETLMMILGSHLLEEPRTIAESAENKKLRRTGENSILADISSSISFSISQALQFCAKWLGNESFAEIKVLLNKEYTSVEADSQLVQALLGCLQSGEISQETFLYNLKVMGLIEDGRTIKEEMDSVESMAQRVSGMPAFPLRTEVENPKPLQTPQQ